MAQIIISIIVLGFIGLAKQRMRYDRLFSWLMFFISTVLFIKFAIDSINPDKESLSFLWNTSKIGDITIDSLGTIIKNLATLKHLLIPKNRRETLIIYY